MIDFTRVYHKDKNKFEKFVLSGGVFINPERKINVHENENLYPITAEEPGVTANIDEYRGYVNGLFKVIYNENHQGKVKRYENLNLKQLQKVIRIFKEYVTNPKDIKISRIYFGLAVRTFKPAHEIIRLNILMHNYHNYNHDILPPKNQVMKIFDYENYAIGVYGENQKEDDHHFIKFEIKLKKSKIFRFFGIESLDDLRDINNLKKLYSILIECFDDMTIVDDISDYGVFGKDRAKMNNYMRVQYWENLAINESKQCRYRHRKRFEEILEKHALTKLKDNFKRSLKDSFENLINNT